MAEFLSQEKPAKDDFGPGNGFDAMGKPVPQFRRQAAYEACEAMGLTDANDRWAVANGMAEQLERDKPYEAMEIGMRYLDLVGTYRVMAVLCTAQPRDA